MNGIHMATNLDDAIEAADLLLLLVKHTEFSELDPRQLVTQTRARIAIDTVNAWDADDWQQAGFQLVRLGVRKTPVFGTA